MAHIFVAPICGISRRQSAPLPNPMLWGDRRPADPSHSARPGIDLYALTWERLGDARLAVVILAAMTVSTMISSVAGAVMPLFMKQLHLDPATATIVVGGITRLVSIAGFLLLAQWLLL